MFDHRAWNTEYMAHPGQNDAADLGVDILPVAGAEYRCIGVHHLTGGENAGNHNVFLDVLDAAGQRITGAVVEHTWEGKQPSENAPPTTIDKPANETGASIPLWSGQLITCWVRGTSDRVAGLTSSPNLPDTSGNTRYHHSYYVVWQRGAAVPIPPSPVHPPDDDDLAQRVADLEATIAAIIPVLESGKLRMAEAMQVTINGVKAAINS